ncbi:MAG: hypothetical protein COT84_00335 [Chlamydiae bacterium CG10_big_fil_rev_8_21_14_0_10_35_9]|nr:MAG: hypothetical protein COT84_00335 [Chlamydiae bacterium CG10_big_fil_rev_8_21_14_0_10_35_9]
MVEKPDMPPRIHPKPIEGIEKPSKERKEAPSKKFLSMSMTKTEFQNFLSGYVKEMLSLIKRGEKRMIEAMRKLGKEQE